MSASELAVSYATLILADDGVEITADKINSLVNAAKVPEFEPVWATLFAKALAGKDLSSILLNVGSAGSGGAAAAPAAGGAAPAASGGDSAGAAAPAAEEKKEEAKEESDDDMGFGLFD